MLVQFSFGNYLSFNETKTFSLIATSITEFEASNVAVINHYRILKGAIIFGGNASGKSNFVTALTAMKFYIENSSKLSSTDELGVTPFSLSTVTLDQPSFFEILMIIDNVRYRYGFELTNSGVTGEWLFETKKKKERLLFIREGDGIEVTKSFSEGEDLVERTRDNALFLAVADQFNGPIANRIMKWFKSFYSVSSIRSHHKFSDTTSSLLTSEEHKGKLKNLFTNLDLDFSDIVAEKVTRVPSPDSYYANWDEPEEQHYNVYTIHHIHDENKRPVKEIRVKMSEHESAGTNKIYNLVGLIYTVLNTGGVLVIDEMDAGLHPIIVKTLTRLFNSLEQNPNNAQLIFTTHDINLLENGNYRRDQIYFVEKDYYNASNLYSLVEFREPDGKAVRKDRSFEKDYMKGRYGGVPFVKNLTKLLENVEESK